MSMEQMRVKTVSLRLLNMPKHGTGKRNKTSHQLWNPKLLRNMQPYPTVTPFQSPLFIPSPFQEPGVSWVWRWKGPTNLPPPCLVSNFAGSRKGRGAPERLQREGPLPLVVTPLPAQGSARAASYPWEVPEHAGGVI